MGRLVAFTAFATVVTACGQPSGPARSAERPGVRPSTASTLATPTTTTTVPVTTTTPPPPPPCPGAVAWSDAAAHIGERVSVQGPVMSASWHSDVSGAPTFVNLGRDYPDPGRMQLLIWGENRARFPGGTPESSFPAGSTVCATGTVTSYRGVPEIALAAPTEASLVTAAMSAPQSYDDPGYDPTYDDPGYDPTYDDPGYDPTYDDPGYDSCDGYDC